MRTLSVFAFACLLGGAVVCQSAGLTFEQMKPESKARAMNIQGIKRQALENAVQLHNLIVDVRGIDDLRSQLLTALRTHKLQEDRLEALERCSVAKLSDQFKQPEEVWNKMKEEYARREKELAIYVNSAKEATEEETRAFQRRMDNNELTPDMVTELLSPWQIGNDILRDVYQNQDAWGERKSEKAPSFPLWEDQKYQFDKEWNSRYNQINAYFGVPPQGRPIIGDEKYDYARAKDVEKAHATYLALLTAKSPLKAAAMPPSWRKPLIAPKPLPPKMETVVYLDVQNPEARVYPALPEPWQKYAENGFKDRAPKGEMAEDFSNGLTLKESAKTARKTNRLVAYSSLKETVDNTGYVDKIMLTSAAAQIDQLRMRIANYIPIDPQADLLDPAVQAETLTQLREKQKQVLAEAEAELGERVADEEGAITIQPMNLEEIEDLALLKELNPAAFDRIKQNIPASFYEQDKTLLQALKTDEEGTVFINEVNAGDVDKIVKEMAATRAFLAEINDLDKNLALQRSVPIDDTCLNGGL